jgi:hypothetical protein
MALRLLSLVLFEMRRERIQPSLPRKPSTEDPLLHRAKALRLESTPPYPATFLPRDQAGRGKDLKMLMDRCERHRERRRQVRDARPPAREAFDHGPARGIREGPKRITERAGLMVKQ